MAGFATGPAGGLSIRGSGGIAEEARASTFGTSCLEQEFAWHTPPAFKNAGGALKEALFCSAHGGSASGACAGGDL